VKALILGASGQDGFYLTELCRAKGIEPIGISRSGNNIRANIADYRDVEQLIIAHRPDYVFHLAANSTTRHDALFENHDVISTGSVNLLEAVRRHAPMTRVFITGSGVQFVNRGIPISELDEFEASSPYSVARIHSVYAARYYRSLGIRTYVGYLFHHESSFRKPIHISQKIIQAAKRIAAGSKEVVELGDVSVQKEWTFAGDIVKGIFTLVGQDNVYESTIGSGVTHSIKDWLEQCFGLVGKSWQNHITIRQGFKAEYQILVSNPATITSLGWQPKKSFDELARLMMDAQ